MKIILNIGLLLIILMSACTNFKATVKPTYNNGGYTFDKYKNKNSLVADSVIVTGKIISLNSDELLSFSTIKLGCISQQINSGTYRLKVRPFDVKSQLTAISLGYLAIETEPFVTQSGDSIVVNFYLVQDERQLMNCEGSGK